MIKEAPQVNWYHTKLAWGAFGDSEHFYELYSELCRHDPLLLSILLGRERRMGRWIGCFVNS